MKHPSAKPGVIELFAGAGGLGVGARCAGAQVLLTVELDAIACRTLRLNRKHHGGAVLQADVGKLNGVALRELAKLKPGQPLIVTGGPPCQPFSKAAYWADPGHEARYRRARERGMSVSRPDAPPVRPDDRRSLVIEFISRAIEAQADGFVFENVPSITHPRHRPLLDDLIREAQRAGYHTTFVRAHATQFGVPQRRERVFVLGARAAKPVAPTPTHDGEQRPFVTAGAALRGVEAPPEPEEEVKGRWAAHLRDVPPGWNYKAHTAWAGHPKPTFVTETRFWNFLLKLSPDLPAWTVPASPGPWTGPFHWDGRRLRIPELAALQGFPPGYKVAGTRRERVRQMGNAVPPPLAAAMVASVIAALKSPRIRSPRAAVESQQTSL